VLARLSLLSPSPPFPTTPGMPASLTRRVTFAAAHRYRVASWSDERNAQVFGLCARSNYHGHSYTCDVTVRGELDGVTGMIVDLAALDHVLAREVRERFDHRNINMDVPEFGENRLVPTGENLARFIFERVQQALKSGGVLVDVTSVTVGEDATLSATWTA
jgi:6-pyruvoyltetrahydropterin/6-carboxytetrahydropterin synthase